MEWSVFLQDQINSVLSLRTKAEKCLCSGCAVWLLYISIKLFQAKVFVVIEDLYLRNCNWAYLFSGPAAACVFPAKSEQVTPPAYCGLNIWPQSNTLQLQPNIFRGQACNAMRKLEKNLLGIYDCYQWMLSSLKACPKLINERVISWAVFGWQLKPQKIYLPTGLLKTVSIECCQHFKDAFWSDMLMVPEQIQSKYWYKITRIAKIGKIQPNWKNSHGDFKFTSWKFDIRAVAVCTQVAQMSLSPSSKCSAPSSSVHF